MPDISIAEVATVTDSGLESEKQRLEGAAFRVLYPPLIADSLIKNPKILDKLESQREEVLWDVATNENPAHAFEFATWKLPPEQKRSLQRAVINFFNDNSENGILFRLRGNALKGFVTSKSPEDLEKLICKIDNLMKSLSNENLGEGGFGFFVAEPPELQVKISPMGKKDAQNPHYIMIPASDTGLTYLSWASKAARESGNKDASGKVYWVSTERQEKNRGNLRRDHVVENIEPTEHYSAKANVRFYTRDLTAKFSESNVQDPEDKVKFNDQLLNDFQHLPQIQRERILRCGVAGFPGNILISDSGSWMDRKITPEGIQLETTGAHAKFKFDFSGMSGLAARGVSIGPYLKDVFSELTEITDGDEKIGNYLMLLEGDALVLYLMLPDLKGKDMVEHYVAVQDKLSSAFSDRLDRDIQTGKLTGVMNVHEVGLKLFARVSDSPISINFYNGGVCLIADPEFTKWEDTVEGYAKKGGFVAGIIHDSGMNAGEIEEVYRNIPHQTLTINHPDNPDQQISVHLIRKDSLYEQKYEAFTESLKQKFPSLDLQIERIKEALYQLTSTPTPENGKRLLTIENNILTSAKIILLAQELVRIGLKPDVVRDQIVSHFKDNTGKFILNFLNNPNGVDKELEVAGWLKTELRATLKIPS